MSFEVIKTFENKIAEFFGSPYAVAVDCCTHGIESLLIPISIESLKFLENSISPINCW